MSVRLMALVFDTEGLSSTQKLVMLSLADHANEEGRSIYPSVKRICDKTSLRERVVRRTLSELRDTDGLNLIRITGQSTMNHPNEYAINIKALRKMATVTMPDDSGAFDAPPAPSAPGAPHAEPPALSAEPPALSAPNPSVNHQEPSEARTPAVDFYFKTFRRKRWSNPAQAELFAKIESEIGQETITAAIRWAAEKGISDLHAIHSAGKKMAAGPRSTSQGVSPAGKLNGLRLPDGV